MRQAVRKKVTSLALFCAFHSSHRPFVSLQPIRYPIEFPCPLETAPCSTGRCRVLGAKSAPGKLGSHRPIQRLQSYHCWAAAPSCCSKVNSNLRRLLEAHLKSTGCQGLLSLRTCPPGARVSDRRGPVVPRVQEPVAHRQRKHHGNRLGVVAREEVRQPHPADIFCGEHEARVPGLDGAVRTTEGMQT